MEHNIGLCKGPTNAIFYGKHKIYEGYIAYLLTALRFTLSLSEPIGRSLLSLRRELLSSSVLGMDERTPKPVCCDIPSDFPTPTAPLATPGLYYRTC